MLLFSAVFTLMNNNGHSVAVLSSVAFHVLHNGPLKGFKLGVGNVFDRV